MNEMNKRIESNPYQLYRWIKRTFVCAEDLPLNHRKKKKKNNSTTDEMRQEGRIK